MTDKPEAPFEQLVLTGGGTRCFWQGGFLHALQSEYRLAPQRVAAISGGAYAAACVIAGCGERSLEVFGDLFEQQSDHVEAGTDGLRLPQPELYRTAVERTFGDEALHAICNGPSFQVFVTVLPDKVPVPLESVAGIAAYKTDKIARSNPHISYPSKLGFTHKCIDARQAAEDGQFVELLLATASIPPVFDLPYWDGQQVLDGGLVDHAPMPRPDQGRTLIVSTQPYDDVPQMEDRTYIMPPEELPASRLDFTSRDTIELAWKLGEDFFTSNGLRQNG